MFYRLFSFLKFWIASSNQHGVHSPFVFQFVTKCLYAVPNFTSNRSHNILLKTIAYFKINQVQLVSSDVALEEELTTYFKGVSITNNSSELIFIGAMDRETIQKFIVHNSHISNDTVVYLEGLYTSAETHKLWTSIKQLEKVRVTIDLFYGGLVFFRREQVKEHFKIRI